MTEPDTTEHVVRTDEGASIQVEISRGENTRDQEKWRIKGKGANALQAVEELRHNLEEVVGDLDADPLAEQVRDFQPGEEDE